MRFSSAIYNGRIFITHQNTTALPFTFDTGQLQHFTGSQADIIFLQGIKGTIRYIDIDDTDFTRLQHAAGRWNIDIAQTKIR